MQCSQHSDVVAESICTRCDQFLCRECLQERNGRSFCASCAQFLDRRKVQRTTGSIPVVRPSPAAAPPATAPPAAAPPATAPPAAAPPVALSPPAVPSPPAARPAPVALTSTAAAATTAAAPVVLPPVPPPPPAAAPPVATPPAETPPATAPSAASEPYLGTPVSQISAPSKTNVWAHDDGIIPLKKDVEAASPAAADGELYTGGDLFLGEPPENGEIPAAEGDLYTPDPAQGDVYQGDVYQGDVYQGPVAEAAAAEEVPSGVPLRGLIVGIFAGTLAAVLWYTLTVTTHWQFSWVSWLVGIGVAVATVAGTGRGGTDVAVMAAGITALALLLGEFQIAKYFDEQQKVIYEQAENIERDGEYTDREVAMLAGITYEDFADLSDNEKQWVRVLAQLGDEEYEAYGGYDSGEDGSDSVDSTSWQDETLSLGFFLGNLKSFLGFKGLLIWLVGVGSAFRLGMGKMD